MSKKPRIPFDHPIFIILMLAGFLFSSLLLFSQSKVPATPDDPHQPFNFTGKNGMVVAAHPLAAEAGSACLKGGGNAIDAAVTTAFALNAAEPFASGIGGGGFMVIYLAVEKKVIVINFREKAPSGASPRMFHDQGEINESWRKTHGLAVGVPGALAGWSYALEKYGTQDISEVMQRGIEIAEKGFSVSKTFSEINKDEYEKLVLMGGEESCYLNDGFPYEPGDVFKNPELAKTFRDIADNGIQEFYRGQLAQKIIEEVRLKGGILSLEDLTQYQPAEQIPLKGTYKDHTIYTINPPGSGGLHIIQLLNIMEKWPIKKWTHNSPAYIHHLCEAFRFIFSDRAHYLGDPDFVSIPVDNLISKEYSALIASQIDPERPLDSYPYGKFDEKQNEKESTTHLCVADSKGNVVSLTQSINHFFGSGIIPKGTGFLLNNHMDDFSRDPDSPNAPGPNKRPVSSMAPFILFKAERPFLILGSPGGTRIFPSLIQIVLNVIDFDLALDEAIEAPRFFSYSSQGRARSISLESRITEETVKKLKSMGHQVTIRESFDKYFGGAQGIMILFDEKTILGGADSRRDGHGAGY